MTGTSVHPDGRILCCLQITNECPGYVQIEDLATDPDGVKINVCKPCSDKESAQRGVKVYRNAAGESVDPYVQQEQCPKCGKLVWLAPHRCHG